MGKNCLRAGSFHIRLSHASWQAIIFVDEAGDEEGKCEKLAVVDETN
jgi:hypothetical protein